MAENLADVIVQLKADFGDPIRQIADLKDDLKDLGGQAAAVSAQMNLFGDALNDVPFADAAGQLNLFANELEPVGAFTADVADGVAEASEQTRSWKDVLSDLVDKLTETSAAEESAAENASSLFKELLAFAGIAVSLEALKEMVVETFESFAKEERATEALTALMKSSRDAENAIEELRTTSLKLAVSNETLRNSFQQMVARGFEVEKITPLLHSVADASRAMNTSFEGIANMMERMIQSGTLNTRMLTRLGLSIDDVAKAMNTTAGDAPKMFKALVDQSDRIDVVTAALGKFKGLAESTAADLTGSWTNMKNVLEMTFEDIGKQLEPLGKDLVAWAQDTIGELKDMALNVIELGKGFAALPPIVKEVGAYLTLYFATNPAVALAASLFQLALAAAGVRKAEEDASKQEKQYSDSLSSTLIVQRRLFADFPEFQKKLSDLADEWDQGKKSDEQFALGMMGLAKAFREIHPAAEEAAKDAKKVHAIPYDQMKIQIDEETKHQQALLKQKQEAYMAQAARDGLNESDQLVQLAKFAQQEWEITRDGINRKLALEKTSKEAEKDLTLNSQLVEATDKRDLEIQKLGEKATAEQKKQIAVQVKNEVDGQEAEAAAEKAAMDHSSALYQQLNLAVEKGNLEQEQNDLKHQMAGFETERAVNAARLSNHQITVFEKIALDDLLDAKETEAQKKSLQNELAMLEQEDALESTKVAKRIAINAQIQTMEDKTGRTAAVTAINNEAEAWRVLGQESDKSLRKQIKDTQQAIGLLGAEDAPQGAILAGLQKQYEQQVKLGALTGEDTSKAVVGLKLAGMQIQALSNLSHSLASDIQVGLLNAFENAFTTIGKGIVNVITLTDRWGKAAKDVAKSIATDILNEIIGAALKKLMSTILVQIGLEKVKDTAAVVGNKALMDSNALLILSYAAVGAAGVAAQTAVTAAVASAVVATKTATGLQNALQVESYMAVFDAATMAAYASIPFVGPGLAAAQIAAALPVFQGLAATAAIAKQGFDVGDKEVLTLLHPREMVLPENLAENVRGMNASGSQLAGNSNSGDHFDFRGASFGAGLTQGMVSTMMNNVFRQARLSGMKPKLA